MLLLLAAGRNEITANATAVQFTLTAACRCRAGTRINFVLQDNPVLGCLFLKEQDKVCSVFCSLFNWVVCCCLSPFVWHPPKKKRLFHLLVDVGGHLVVVVHLIMASSATMLNRVPPTDVVDNTMLTPNVWWLRMTCLFFFAGKF